MDEKLHKKLIGGWYCCPPPDDGDGAVVDKTDGDGTPADGGGADDDDGDPSPYTDEELQILSGQTPHTDDDDDPGPGADDPADGDDDIPAPIRQKIADLEKTIEDLKSATPGKQEPGEGGDKADAPDPKDPRNTVVEYEDPKHPYHGKTLGQIFDLNPREAFAIDPYLATQVHAIKREEEQEAKRQDEAAIAQVEKEKVEFMDEYAKLEFDKPFGELSAKDQALVESRQKQVTDWMLNNGKYGITISEAHFLMDRNNIIAKASSKATSKVIKDASRGDVRTIHTQRDPKADKDSPEDMVNWDAKRMSDHIDKMNGAEFNKFMKTAPKAVKDKFPAFPWM